MSEGTFIILRLGKEHRIRSAQILLCFLAQASPLRPLDQSHQSGRNSASKNISMDQSDQASLGGRLMCTNKCRRPFSASWGPSEQSPRQKPNYDELSNEKAYCRNVSATFSRSLKCSTFQRKCKNAFFLRTIFANGKTHLGPTLNTWKVGA